MFSCPQHSLRFAQFQLSGSLSQDDGYGRLTINRVISVELLLRVRVTCNDFQNPEFKILDCQNPEFNLTFSVILISNYSKLKLITRKN